MKAPRFQVYQARDGWRWRLKAANGRIIADSGEAYTRKRDADRAVATVQDVVVRLKAKTITQSFQVTGPVDVEAVRRAARCAARAQAVVAANR